MATEDILLRMREAIDAKNDSQLASYLGTTSSVISNWRARDRRPLSECEKISIETGVSMDWLLTGQGLMRRDSVPQSVQELPLKVRKLLDLVLDMDEERQEQVLRRAEDQKRAAEERREMNELRDELARLKAGQRVL